MTAPWPPLRHNRDFQLLWMGQLLSLLGSQISSVAYPLLVLTLTGSPAQAGLVGLVGNAPFVLLQLPAGAYVDRWNRRAVMIVCDCGRALALGSIAVAAATGQLSYTQILLVAGVEGSLFVPFRLAETAALRRVVPAQDQLSDAIAANQGRTYGTSLAGGPIGGLLFGVRLLLPFAADAVSYLASLGTILAIRTPLSAPTQTQQRHLWREIREGLGTAWRHRFLRTTSLLTTGSDFVINGLFLIDVVVATQHGASATQVGLMLALGGAGGMLGSFAAPLLRRRIHSVRLIITVTLWSSVPLLGLTAVTTNALVLGALLGLILFAWPLYNAVVVSRWMVEIPDEQMGRVQGAVALLGWAPVPFAPLLGGILIERIGSTKTVIAYAVLMVAVAVAATLARSIRNVSTAKPTRAVPLWPSADA